MGIREWRQTAPVRGERNAVSYAPLGLILALAPPTTCVVGYLLSPLPGLGGTQPGSVLHAITADFVCMSGGNSAPGKLLAVALCIKDQALKPVPQEKPAPVRLSLRDERQKDVPHFRADHICLKQT